MKPQITLQTHENFITVEDIRRQQWISLRINNWSILEELGRHNRKKRHEVVKETKKSKFKKPE